VVGTIALSLATFMNVLDTSIANVSIPNIAGDLGVSPDQGTWGDHLVRGGQRDFAAADRLADAPVRSGAAVTVVGWRCSCWLHFCARWLLRCKMLILFRVLQGAVAGPMIPLSQSLLLASYPPARAGTALAMWAMTTLVAPVVGPVLAAGSRTTSAGRGSFISTSRWASWPGSRPG